MRSWLDGDVVHRLDRTRYDRVLANLLENADRYGGGVSSVQLLRHDGDLVIWVDDAGPGVDPAERTAIFGRFHRGSIEQPPDRPKGTGLGLALVDEHVRMHGGSVSVTDSPFGGARFVIHLPRIGMNRARAALGPSPSRSSRRSPCPVACRSNRHHESSPQNEVPDGLRPVESTPDATTQDEEIIDVWFVRDGTLVASRHSVPAPAGPTAAVEEVLCGPLRRRTGRVTQVGHP